MHVTQVQMLGDRLHVFLKTDKHSRVVASVDGYAQLKSRDTLPIFFDMSRALFFSPGDEGVRLNGAGR
jgi:hypothetical protein